MRYERRTIGIALALPIMLAVTSGVVARGAARNERATLWEDARAYILREDCSLDEAVDKFRAVIDSDPGHPDNDQVLLAIADILRQGDSYGGEREPATAELVYRAVIDKFPLNRKPVVLAHIGLGDLYFIYDRREDARKAYEFVLKIDTTGPEWDDLRDWVEQQALALRPVIATTVVVPRDELRSLANLRDLKQEYGDDPEMVKQVDKLAAQILTRAAGRKGGSALLPGAPEGDDVDALIDLIVGSAGTRPAGTRQAATTTRGEPSVIPDGGSSPATGSGEDPGARSGVLNPGSRSRASGAWRLRQGIALVLILAGLTTMGVGGLGWWSRRQRANQ